MVSRRGPGFTYKITNYFSYTQIGFIPLLWQRGLDAIPHKNVIATPVIIFLIFPIDIHSFSCTPNHFYLSHDYQ